MANFILRFTGGDTAPAAHVKQIHAEMTVLDASSPKMMLVQATPQSVRRLMESLPGWEASAERFVPLPDAKPKLKHPA